SKVLFSVSARGCAGITVPSNNNFVFESDKSGYCMIFICAWLKLSLSFLKMRGFVDRFAALLQPIGRQLQHLSQANAWVTENGVGK
ncbi:MAG TPA: hypothetical protein PLQ65_08085, partial [Flavihumibacter sp.]|nr:hypothetical protein [Flavihumibacter sp.]